MMYSSLTIFGEEGRQLISYLPQDTDFSLSVPTGKFSNPLSNSWLSAQVLKNAGAFRIVIALRGECSTEKSDH